MYKSFSEHFTAQNKFILSTNSPAQNIFIMQACIRQYEETE